MTGATRPEIAFEAKGIGQAISQNRFVVPMNQREYKWEREHVVDLFHDLANAIDADSPTYFLGTLVLTGGDPPEVADGQQRLATVTILLAAIRDHLYEQGDTARIESIEADFLRRRDFDSGRVIPRLQLNLDDNEFFVNYVLEGPADPKRKVVPRLESHRRIQQAAEEAKAYVKSIVAPLRPEDGTSRLKKWVDFLNKGVLVILARVPSHLNAFVMFETLNDRGLKASQADLLKNYLLLRAKERASEAQHNWARMLGVLDSLGIDDLIVTYLRHVVIQSEGPTKERELYERVEASVKSQSRAIEFCDALAESATAYAAILNPTHSFWNAYPAKCSRYVATLQELQIEQIRPLVFAIVRRFDPAEAEQALRLCVAWSIRFLIVGGRGGLLDRHYALAAQGIGKGEIKTVRELKAKVDIVPTDAEFEAAFATARVSKSYLAKYYLRALELQVKNDPEPELIPNEDAVLNLEHVLPENPHANWLEVSAEDVEANKKRLGNMVLLQAKKNSTIGNAPFSEKRVVLAESSLHLTAEVGAKKKWGAKEIAARQARLAKLAVLTWPI